MKYIVFVLLFAACTKDASNNIISGKWNIILDSYYSGAGMSNHMVTYKGTIDDYFNFENGSKLYIKEGVNFETLNYKLIADTAIIIESFPDTCHIKITDGNAIIVSPIYNTPGGSFGRSVYLNR